MDKIFAYDGKILCFYRDGVWTKCSLEDGAVKPIDITVDFIPPVERMTLREAIAQLGHNFATAKPKRSRKTEPETDDEDLPDSFI